MKRANNIDYSYFKSIDTEYKAYILGFIYADGCVLTKPKGNRQKQLIVSIQKEDGYILEKLLKDINNNTLITRNPPSAIKNGWKAQAQAVIASTEIVDDLIALGCLPNKSEVGLIFPKLDAEMIPHFIRGFFDGDGCITIKKDIYKGKKVTTVNYSKRIALTSTDSSFLDILCKYLPITKLYKRVKKRKLLVHTYWIERQQDIQTVKNYLYNDATVFLKRKKEKFDMTIKSEALDVFKERLETT